MKARTRYILLITSIIGFSLLIFLSVKMQYWGDVKFQLELDISKVLFVIGTLSFGLYPLKGWGKVFTKVMIGAFGICLVLNLHLLTEFCKNVQRQNRLEEYYDIETCAKMENRFLIDLKNEELKYFQFGIGFDLELQKTLESKYGIESYGMGCVVHPKFDCYNDLVNNYLKEKHNDGIIDFDF